MEETPKEIDVQTIIGKLEAGSSVYETVLDALREECILKGQDYLTARQKIHDELQKRGEMKKARLLLASDDHNIKYRNKST